MRASPIRAILGHRRGGGGGQLRGTREGVEKGPAEEEEEEGKKRVRVETETNYGR